MAFSWSPGGCCCGGGCGIATHRFVADGDGGLIGWTVVQGSVTVNEDGSIELAANTRIILDALPAKVEYGDQAVVSFPAINGKLRIGHPIGNGVRGEFFDVISDEVSFSRVMYSTEIDNPQSIPISEYPVSVLLRTESIDASEGGTLAISCVDQLTRGKFAPAGESVRGSDGQSIYAHPLRMMPNLSAITHTDPRWPSISSEAWPGDDYVNAATDDFLTGVGATVENRLMLESFDEPETIAGIKFEQNACYEYKYWGGGFRETANTWNFSPSIDFDTGGVHALVNGGFLSSYWIDIVQFGDDSTYLLDYNRGSSWSTNDVVIYDQSTGKYIDAYWDNDAWERVVRVNGFVGLDPSGEYELSAISRNSTTSGGSTGNGAVTRFTYDVPVSGNGYSKSMRVEVLIWYRADLDETILRVRMYLGYSAVPGSPRHEWTFQKIVPGLLSEETSSHTLDIIPAGIVPFEWDAPGGYTGGVFYDAPTSSYVSSAGRMRPNGSTVYEHVPTGGKRGGTCTISW
ncbi:hypothetical protein Poly24_08960 [Rosistilla carotiformis]|uniref:Uncharacterized protein n=1 Tax=Rosistilla carotiformis TaxID=2528017 RepID=A0A518JNS9_9BACT|nr:hypothetical protein [Rosistilla carotiformis]QDV67204.1 hypothetical protein Poly24_08960 [Rosistilla carotiformis]